MSRRRKNGHVLDILLVILLILATGAAVCSFRITAQPDESGYELAEKNTATARLAGAALLGGDVAVTYPELNRLIADRLPAQSGSVTVQTLKLRPDSEKITIYMQLRTKNRTWHVTATGAAQSVSDGDAVIGVTFAPERVVVGKQAVPRMVWQQMAKKWTQQSTNISMQNGALTYTFPELPVILRALRVQPDGVQLTVTSVFHRENDAPESNPDSASDGDHAISASPADISAFLENAKQRLLDGRATLTELWNEWKAKFPQADASQFWAALKNGWSDLSSKWQSWIGAQSDSAGSTASD